MTRKLAVAAAGMMLAAVGAGSPAAAGAQPATTQVTPTSYRGATPRADSARVVEEERTGVLTIDRESYAYSADGRRDPFRTLMVIGDLRPLVSDLRLVVVAYDPAGGSVAILRDLVTDEQYRVRVGHQLGRMRVSSIRQKEIVFTIEEFGFSRQETLALGDPTTARTQQ
ncbi:MAG TPA: hypothetical protein VGE02_04545 [Gemmatimonadales bacterium]